jgi:hypothetical protein
LNFHEAILGSALYVDVVGEAASGAGAGAGDGDGPGAALHVLDTLSLASSSSAFFLK